MSFVRALGESIPRISARNEGRRKIGRGKGMKKNRHAVSLYFPERGRELSAFQEYEQERKGRGIMERRGRKKGRTLEEAEKQGHKIEEG